MYCQSGFAECGKQFIVSRQRHSGVLPDLVQGDGPMTRPDQNARGFPIRFFTVETNQLNSVGKIGFDCVDVAGKRTAERQF